MSKTKEKLFKEIQDNYWACGLCILEAGGKAQEGHCFTVIHGECKTCGSEGVMLIPWVDFNWKNKKIGHLRD